MPAVPALWEREITAWEERLIVPGYPLSQQGWYDPVPDPLPLIVPQDHAVYYQYNITGIEDPFVQVHGSIYWLNITANVAGPEQWGWKSSADHFNDDAVWGVDPGLVWDDLYEPEVITPDVGLFFGGWDEFGELIPDRSGGTGFDSALKEAFATLTMPMKPMLIGTM